MESSRPSIDSSNIHHLNLKNDYDEILFIGGSNSTLSKLGILLEESPEVKVRLVASVVSESFRREHADNPNVQIEQRDFQDRDLEEASYIVVGLNNEEVCRHIKEFAEERGKWVYFTNYLEWSNFYITSREKNDRIIRILGSPEEKENFIATIKWRKAAFYIVFAFIFMIVGYIIFHNLPLDEVFGYVANSITEIGLNTFALLMLTGCVAEMVNGSVGMGYKVITMAVLQSFGFLLPSAVSASTHTASMFSGGVLGYSHYRFGNVNKKMLQLIIVPAIVGAVIGAVLVSVFGDKYAYIIKPLMACYTFVLGMKIMYNALKSVRKNKKITKMGRLGFLGGFLDSFAGGGWGPIMTSSLISGGRTPRFVVGTVSVVEFFICVSSVLTFLVMGKIGSIAVILALVIGGVIAAPIAATITGRLPKKPAYIVVATLVMLWSLRVILGALGIF